MCFSCISAVEKKLIRQDVVRLDNTFVKGGFTNWRKSTEKFKEHERSDAHSRSVEKLSSLGRTPISAMLSNIAAEQQQIARNVLELLFRSIRFLGRKGVPFRGDTTRDGILYEYMLERTYNLPEENAWVRRRDNWMSDTVQNEIIKMFGLAVQMELVSRSSECTFYGLTADGTTDISTMEQFSCSLQYVDKDLESHCDFLGFYNAPDSTAQTLFTCVKDVFLRLNIPIERLAGFCFDGASNMSGRFNGVQAKLKELCPDSMYVHCCNHSLDLVLQEVARDVSLVADALNFVQGVAVVINESSKRKQLFESLFGMDEVVTNILGLCPTRWCVRTKAITRVCASYSTLVATLDTLKDDTSVRGETRAKITGLRKQALKGKTFFSLLCCSALFEPCEIVAKTLQSPKASALGALQCANILKERVAALRKDAVMDKVISQVNTCAPKLGLIMPTDTAPPRVSRTPARFRHTANPEVPTQAVESAEQRWRREFYEALDLVEAELTRRFDQDSMRIAASRETTIINAAQGTVVFDAQALRLPMQLDTERLQLQLQMLGDIPKNSPCTTVTEVASCLTKLTPQTREMFCEVEKFIQLCLSLPISVASSERSFSTLRRLKTWTRSTMTQKRLTHLTLMHVHSDIMDGLDIHAMMREFISVNPERKSTFGIV